MLNIVLCEDDERFRKLLSRNIRHLLEEKNIPGQIVASCSSSKELENQMDSLYANVFILDICMETPKSGLELAKKIHDKFENAFIIFISAYSENVFQVFKVYAFDFLPKPVNAQSINDLFDRLYDEYQKSIEKEDYIEISYDRINYRIPVNSIVFVERDSGFGTRCTFHTKTEQYPYCQSLKEIQNMLIEKGDFVRCHNSYIANMKLRKIIDPVLMEITFLDSRKVPIGGVYKDQVLKYIKK